MLAHELGAGLERTPLRDRRDRRHEPARGLVARGAPRFALAGDLVEEAQGRAIEVAIGVAPEPAGGRPSCRAGSCLASIAAPRSPNGPASPSRRAISRVRSMRATWARPGQAR